MPPAEDKGARARLAHHPAMADDCLRLVARYRGLRDGRQSSRSAHILSRALLRFITPSRFFHIEGRSGRSRISRTFTMIFAFSQHLYRRRQLQRSIYASTPRAANWPKRQADARIAHAEASSARCAPPQRPSHFRPPRLSLRRRAHAGARHAARLLLRDISIICVIARQRFLLCRIDFACAARAISAPMQRRRSCRAAAPYFTAAEDASPQACLLPRSRMAMTAATLLPQMPRRRLVE